LRWRLKEYLVMTRLTKSALLFASAALLATPALAVEPDVDSPAGPELPAPRTDRPDFQVDDQTGAPLDPMAEGADPSPPGRDAMVVEPAPMPDDAELPEGKTEDSDPSD
jgi:hypothetical protein